MSNFASCSAVRATGALPEKRDGNPSLNRMQLLWSLPGAQFVHYLYGMGTAFSRFYAIMLCEVWKVTISSHIPHGLCFVGLPTFTSPCFDQFDYSLDGISYQGIMLISMPWKPSLVGICRSGWSCHRSRPGKLVKWQSQIFHYQNRMAYRKIPPIPQSKFCFCPEKQVVKKTVWNSVYIYLVVSSIFPLFPTSWFY